ncbi:MAG TPA: arylsulfotransferase family protein [Solirubrobacteraceae bacterium]|nr:arylsulfotransferase family protein [Solirubrobacteraceae bacterium]
MPFCIRAVHASVAAAFFSAVALGLAAPESRAVATAPSCVPSTLNESAALANGAVTVTPAPDTLDASYLSQISFLGPPTADITDVKVSGSRSGTHSGRLLAYSQGDGASFVPTKPFTQGEIVTIHAVVRGLNSSTPIAWRFTVAEVDSVSRSLETPPPPPPPPKPSELQHFVSRPDLQPPAVDVTTSTGSQAPGDIFLAPYAGPGQYGPMILDGSGKLVWFKPIPAGERAADLRVQEYEGHPVLTWWQDPLVSGGQRDAGVVIANSAYEDIAIVRAGNGYQPDLHAFAISSRGTALFTVYDAIRCNLSAYGGPANGAVADTLFQEIDLRTGLVRFEWHALDHVPVANSYMPIGGGGTPRSPWDWFHINAVSEHGPNLLVDSRNTWAAYEVQASGGQVAWRLGGKQSSFAMGPGAAPAYQHDVREEPDGTISFFDNGGTPKVHPQSRVIVLSLNRQKMTATLVSSFTHTPPLSAPSQGDFQPQADGNWFVGWGQEPYFSEFAPEGKLLLDAHLPALYQSYTVLKFPWAASPTQPPRLVVRAGPQGGLVAYASWNGATAVTQWALLGGASPHALSPLAVAPRSGFETAISSPSAPRYLAAQALGAQGQVLGTSATATVKVG